MASLRDTVKQYQEELRDGIAWVAFWREGRSWNAEYFSLDLNDTLYPEDTARLKEIRETDPAAVIVNGYYSGQLGAEMSLGELTAGVRSHYENGTNNIAGFIEAHDDRLSPEAIEKGRAIAHAAGLPFSEKPYRGDEDFDPYVFDGSMSIEDYELMHRMIAQERSGRMSEPFSVLIDSRSRFETGEPGGVWLPMPTTTEQLHEAMKSVGITADNPQDFFINGFTNTEDCPFDVPLEVIQRGSMDELNYLGRLLSMQSDEDKSKFTAAVTLGERAGNLKDLINLAQNLDCYWIYPTVQSEEDYGYYLVDELGEPELPEEAKKYFMYEEYGRDAAINDGGRFTEQGYIYNNKNTFTEWYDGQDVPEEYRIMSYPQPELKKETAQEFPPLITVTFDENATSDERLHELNKQLEIGVGQLFSQGRYPEYLQAMATFHTYSAKNALLIALQKPGASFVAGFSTWEREYGRRPVEKSIKILAPKPFTTRKQVKKIDPQTHKPVIGADGKPVMEEKEIVVPKYKVVSVFDVSQTKGQELPALTEQEQADTVRAYPELLDAVRKASPYPISFAPLPDSTGICNDRIKQITIREGMDEQQTIQAAIYGTAYAKLTALAEADPKLPRPAVDMKKLQADSVAYAVCYYYGLDTSGYSFDAVQQLNSRELSDLRASFSTIHKAAKEILLEIDRHFLELQHTQDKTQSAGQEQPAQEAATGQTISETNVPEQPKADVPTPEQTTDTDDEAPQPTEKEEQAVQKTQHVTPYYSINKTAARRAKDANSFYDYKPGSATAEYRSYVDEAVKIAERQKARVDPMYHEKIDSLLDTYARKLAENMNKGYEIAGRVPSILIAGGSNFPVRKKEKQNAAADRNMEEYREIQGLLDKIRSTGMGGISADDPQAVQKLQSKLADLEKSQETMKAVNAYYRKHKTLDGCPHLSPENIEKLKAGMSSSWHLEDKPYPTWALSNNNAEIRRVKSRIQDLSQKKEIGFIGWEFEGGRVDANAEANRLQIFFDEKPDEATRTELKGGGFRWSPTAEAWQRQLTDNAYYAANSIKSIQPLSGEKPTDLQRAHIRGEKAKAQEQPQAQEQTAEPEPPTQEAEPDKDTFSIYQLKRGDETRDFRFEPYDRLQAAGLVVDRANYELIYAAPLTPDMTLGSIFERFNIDHPADFKGHSLSISDVIMLHQNGQDTAYYADSGAGFRQVPEFLQEQQKELVPDNYLTGEKVTTPRGSFSLTSMNREQMEAAGYGLHHQSEDGKHLIMGNGTQAFAVVVEPPENYLKAAEQTTEQNYNMIDGQINNTPTVDELEAKVKAGEQISLTELAAAVKAAREAGKEAKPEKKPSIRAQLKADKERAKKKPTKSKSQDLERS
ncbi:YodL domain-containing protein [Lachnospiraceae bacterium NSJ-143]|nr:YodL domain-containing protein [Lachnospiraceae bacterium NSJ-143]